MADSSWWRRTDSSSSSSVRGNTGGSRPDVQGGWRSYHEGARSFHSTRQHVAGVQQSQESGKMSKAAAGTLTTDLRLASSPDELQWFLEANYGQLSSQHVSAAFNGLASMKKVSRSAAGQLLQHVLLPALEQKLDEAEAAAEANRTSQLSVLDARSCAVVLTSLAQLQNQQHLPVPQYVCLRVVHLFVHPAVLRQAIPQGICMVAAGAAKLRLGLSESILETLLEALLITAHRGRDPLTPMHVSQTLWGVATIVAQLKRTPPQGKLHGLFLQVAELLIDPQLDLLQACKPIEICNTFAAFVIAHEQLPSDRYAAALLQSFTADSSLRRAIPQDLARTLWALAKLGVEVSGDACRAIAAAFCSRDVLYRAIAQDISNVIWALGTLQQQDALTNEQLCILGEALLDRAQQRTAAPEEISTALWGLATLQADVPRQLLVQLQEQFMQPHILAEIAQDETQSLGLINVLWATAALHKASLIGANKSWRALQTQQRMQREQQRQQRDELLQEHEQRHVDSAYCWQVLPKWQLQHLQEPTLSAAAVRDITDMLTHPRRLAHLTPCSVGLCLWSTATLGGRLSYEQVRALVDRFLEPSCQSLVLPLNFTNLVWGCIRLNRTDVLQEPGVLQQLVTAFFTAGAPGGTWDGKQDPLAAAMLLWGIAHSSCRQSWQQDRQLVGVGRLARTQQRQSNCSWKNWEEQAGQQQGKASGTHAQHLLNQPHEQQQQQQEDGSAAADAQQSKTEQQSADDWRRQQQQQQLACRQNSAVPQKTVQRLFDIFMQRDTLGKADCSTMSTALYAAAMLRHAVTVDYLTWIAKAYMSKLDEAGVTSLVHMIYAVAALQQPAVPQLSSSSSMPSHTGSPSKSAGIPADNAQDKLLVAELVQLCQEVALRLHADADSNDISTCMHGLVMAFKTSDDISSRGTFMHRGQLQQALYDILQQLLLADMLRQLETDTLIDIMWTCGGMAVAHEQLLDALCVEILGYKQDQQRQHTAECSELVGEGQHSLLGPFHSLTLEQQVHQQEAAPTDTVCSREAGRRLDALECGQVLAALASLNYLTDELWMAAVQGCLPSALMSATNAAEHNSSTCTDDDSNAPMALGQRVSNRHVEALVFMCWAAAVGNCCSCCDVVRQLCQTLASGVHADWSSWRPDLLCRVYQVHMWLQSITATTADEAATIQAKSATSGLAGVVTAEQLEMCCREWCAQVACVRPSGTQALVAKLLQSLPGVADVHMEAVTVDGCFSIDIIATISNIPQLVAATAEGTGVVPGGRSGSSIDDSCSSNSGSSGSLCFSIAIEVDGPQHFLAPSQQLNGESRLRGRMLAARGYVLVRLPLHELQQRSSGNREQQLREYIASHVLAALRPITA